MAHPTSYATFISRVAALTITGVTRKHNEPPSRVNPADMPQQFPRLPSGEHRPLTAGGTGGGWPTLRCELVILIHPLMLETDNVKFADTLSIMDATSVALRAANLAEGPVRWSIRADTFFMQGTLYHTVIAEIETTG